MSRQTRENPPTKFTQQDLEKIVELYQSGLTLRQIADQYSVTAMTILNRLKKAGVSMRLPLSVSL